MNVQGNKGEIVIYQTEDGQTSLEVNLVEDTVWLSLNHMVAPFDRDKSVISRHIKNIFGGFHSSLQNFVRQELRPCPTSFSFTP